MIKYIVNKFFSKNKKYYNGYSKFSFRESSMVIGKDNKVLDFQIGTPVKVEFDFRSIWKKIKEYKYTKDDISNIHFIHVHPQGYLKMSDQDRICIKGLAMGLGTDILSFNIITFNSSDFDDVEYCSSAYMYILAEDKIVPRLNLDPNIPQSKVFIMPGRSLLQLKYMSYGNKGRS